MRNTGISTKIEGIPFSVRAAVLIIQDNKLLVAKSANHACYYTVGGTVEVGESTEQAVVREVFEETGYTLDAGRLAFVHERFPTFDGRPNHELAFFYILHSEITLDIPDGTSTDQAPVETLHWLPLDRLSDYELVPSFLKTADFNQKHIQHIVTYD